MAKNSLIKAVKQVKKVSINIPLSKDIADQFNTELELYNKNFGTANTLDFDTLGKKLIQELKSLNISTMAENK
jgi:hypothetical protein